MEQVIVTHVDNTTLKLQSMENRSSVTKFVQNVELLGADTVDITVESATKLNFYIGDKITVIGRDYTLNTPPVEKKYSENSFTYDLQFEGVQYDLMRAAYSVNVDTTTNQIQDLNGEALTGDLKMFLDVLISNVNRVFPAKWVLGTYPDNTETRTEVFGETDNCLSVLQSLCAEDKYNTEFSIAIGVDGVRTLNIGATGSVFPFTFEYGRGKGIYELTRERISSSNIITRLNVFGSTKNIMTSKYRASRLCLPTKNKSQSYLEDAAAIAKFGVWENTKIFDEVYPHRTGTISTVDDHLTFRDSSMDFDLNAKDGQGNTLYLISGTSAKVSIKTGNLAGYEFELTSYDHATKQLKVKQQIDENGYKFPSADTAAFQFAVGDEYTIVDIYLPQSYIDTAEAELQVKGQEYLNRYKQPNVQYGISEVDPFFLSRIVGADVESNIIWVGDYIPVKDSDLEIDKTLRVKSFSRDLLKDYSYSLSVAEHAVGVTTISRIVSEVRGIDNIIRINNLVDPARARRNWLSAQEVLNMVFDPEGEYYSEKIKPLSIETTMLSVGAKSMQFGLVGTVFEPTYGGAKNRVVYTGGVLTHYAILDGSGDPRVWNISDGDVVLGSDAAYYIYAKCHRTQSGGSILFSTTKILSESDPVYYHFLIGVINSVDENNARALALMYGFTTINGRFVKTGRVTSTDGLTYFDLDTGVISGKISFQAGSSGYGNLTDKPDLSVYSLQADVNALVSNLQSQIDGQIMTWFDTYDPTLSNAPATSWTTDAEKDKHLGDLFYNKTTGLGYRFSKTGSVYSWELLRDTDVALALANAAAAQDTADGKRRVFVAQPTTPYEVGDLWSQGTTGDLMKCKVERLTGSYTASDWEKASKYTDDTAVNNLEIGGRNLLKNTSNFKNTSNWTSGYSLTVVSGVLYWAGGGSYNYIRQEFLISKSGNYTFSGNIITWRPAISYIHIYGFDSEDNAIHSSISYLQTIGAIYGAKSKFKKTENLPVGVVKIVFFIFAINDDEITLYDVKAEIGNKATDWTPAPEDVDAKITALDYLKEALQGSTEITGGLVGTNVLLMKTLAGVITGGLSGLNTDNIGFWTGGTYQNALDAIAKVILRKDGSGQFAGGKILFTAGGDLTVGVLAIDAAGNILIKDSNGVNRVIITRGDITTLSAIENSTQNTTVNNAFNEFTSVGTQTNQLANQIVVNNNNSLVTIQCTINSYMATSDSSEGSSYIALQLVNVATGAVTVIDTLSTYLFEASVYGSKSVNNQVVVPAGTYQLRTYYSHINYGTEVSFQSDVSAITTTVFFDGSTQRTEIGKNGIGIIGNATNYSFFGKEGSTFKAVEKVSNENLYDKPGVLASASVASGGGSSNQWGAKTGASSKASTGTYTINHSIGHSNYTVQITPRAASRVGYVSTKGTSSVTLCLTNMSGSVTDTDFDYCIIGNNQ